MRMTCPACGAVSSLDALIGNESARALLVQALAQTQTGKRLIRYVALFRPAQRQLSWDRSASLLGELFEMIQAGRIERHGRIWAAPETAWVIALDEILARRDEGKLTTPLKSHGYLLEILTGQANKAEASAERRGEDMKAGRTPVGGQQRAPAHTDPPDKRPPRPSREEAMAKMEKVKAMIKPTHEGETE